MVRTQIYLTAHEQRALRSLAKATGQTQSQMIRDAVDEFVKKSGGAHRREMMRNARGIWKDHPHPPNVRTLRLAWRRS